MTEVTHLLESRRSRIGRWGGAAVLVCTLHVGGVTLALTQWPEEESEDFAGALTIEMAPLLAAARVDTPDVAHGPLTPEVPPTPEASEKAEEEVAKDLPAVAPSPAPEPEISLPKPPPEEKKKEPEKDEPSEAAPEKEKSAERQELQHAAAPPRAEAQPAPAASPGQLRTLARLQASWQKALIGKLERNKRYPDAASRRGVKGVALVRFKVDRAGHVISVEISQSSGSPILDEEAVALLRRVSPVPTPPDQLTEPMLDNVLPIGFGMKPKQ